MADHNISPLLLGTSKAVDQDFSLDQPRSQSQSQSQSQLKPPITRNSSSRRLVGRASRDRLQSPRVLAADLANATVAALESDTSHHQHPVHANSPAPAVGALSRAYEAFFIQRLQIQTWLKNERKRKAAKRRRKQTSSTEDRPDQNGESVGDRSLDELEKILNRALNTLVPKEAALSRRGSFAPSALLNPKGGTHLHKGKQGEAEAEVRHCDIVLDNSKTLAYGEEDPYADMGPLPTEKIATAHSRSANTSAKEKEAWRVFKHEILRITHALKLKKWRHIPLELSSEISVNRLSGALTNAVYVVAPPPSNLLPPRKNTSELSVNLIGDAAGSRKIPKLLLRIYGPNVSHLIDRESELAVLKRLAKHNVGPSLLGTFTNGRFEEFLNARPLTSLELRDKDTSRMIAKRMKELHEAIELLPEETEAGPMVWRNWEKWLPQCREVLSRIDPMAEPGPENTESGIVNRGGLLPYVCGAPWPLFYDAVQKYREWLLEAAGGEQAIRNRLVFAHNDAQYGNILRIIPTGESPLLLPANRHKQLVVIDFEYANANVRGFEFANHFTEWCYDYHDANAPHACRMDKYPRIEEQKHFIKSYVEYNPDSPPTPTRTNTAPPTGPSHALFSQTPSSTHLPGTTTQTHRFGIYSNSNQSNSSTASIPNFRLDRSASEAEAFPTATTLDKIEEDDARSERVEKETERLLYESRIWRPANSLQWVAWGVVQAQEPTEKEGSDQGKGAESPNGHSQSNNDDGAETSRVAGDEKSDNGGSENEKHESEGFDYLAYAQQRAVFFWADIVDLGIVRLDDLPPDLAEVVKTVKVW